MMRRFRFSFRKLSVLQIAVFLLMTGLFLGILCANIYRNYFVAQIQDFEASIFSRIREGDIDYPGLFRFVLARNFEAYLVFWLLCVTILGVPYMMLKVASFGFFTGFFVSAVTMQYGMKGILLIVAYVFPHGLIYLPVALLSLYKGFEMCRTIYHDNRSHFSEIAVLVRSNLVIILLLAVALLLASFLEAYPGAYLLKKTLGLFI